VRKKGGEMQLSRQTIKQKKCSGCGNKAFVYDSRTGEVICSYCGYVLEGDNISRKQEWRVFTPQEHSEKPRTEILHPGKGTQIGLTLDSHGRYLQPSHQIRRLRKQQKQAELQSSEARNLRIAEPELQKIISKLYLPSNVKELATVIYKMALEQNLIVGRSIVWVMAASVYFSCRILRVPRSLSDFSEVSRCSKKKIANIYRFLYNKLADKLSQKLNTKVQAPSYVQPIDRITGNLNLSMKTAQLATEIVWVAKKEKITQGRDPKGIAAAAVYIACVLNNEKTIQKEIADEAQVTEVTLRNRYKELREKLLFEIPL